MTIAQVLQCKKANSQIKIRSKYNTCTRCATHK